MGGGLPWDPRGPGAAAAWSPTLLGSKLKIWTQPSTLAAGEYLSNITTPGIGAGGLGISDFIGAGGLPYLDRSPFTAQWVPHFDGVNEFAASSSTVGDLAGVSDRYRIMTACYVEVVNGVSATVWQNCALIKASAFWGLHFKDVGGGLYRVFGYHHDGAVKAASPAVDLTLGVGPILVDWWYDGTNINCAVWNGSTWTTATPVAAGALGSPTDILTMGVSFSGTYWGGMPYEILGLDADLTTAERDSARAYLLNRWQASNPAVRYQATTAKAWGNAQNGGTLPLAPAFSSVSMQVFETDSADIDVRAYQNTVALTEHYGDGAIMRGPTGAVAPDTAIAHVGPYTAAVDYRTGAVTLGGSGSRRIFVCCSPKAGEVGTMTSEVHLRASATTTHETQPTDRVVYIDGVGGQALALDGYSATGGVIDGGAAATARTAWMAKIAALSFGAGDTVYFAMGTNDLGSGTLASNYQVALDQWWQDATASVGGATIILQSIIIRPALEATTAPGYRTAVSNVATARSCAYVNGFSIYVAGDLSADNVHPQLLKQPQHVTAIMAALTTAGHAATGKVLCYGDSIVNGSSGTAADWTAASGLPTLLRQARAAA